nr:hypothetical protein CFP56_53122 [Quercus suber]
MGQSWYKKRTLHVGEVGEAHFYELELLQQTINNFITAEKHCLHVLQTCPVNNVFGDGHSPQWLSFHLSQHHRHFSEWHPGNSCHEFCYPE